MWWASSVGGLSGSSRDLHYFDSLTKFCEKSYLQY